MATIRRRGNTYQIRVSSGYDTEGRHKEQAMTWKPEPGMSKRQIEKELQRQALMFEEQCMYGYQSSAIKFETFAEEWFEEYALPRLRHTTYERMRKLCPRTYDALGHKRIDKITPRDVQQFINSLTKDGVNKRTGGGLSQKTIKHYLSFISDVFSYAVRMELAERNPCEKVMLPKPENVEKKIYSQEEMQKLLHLMNGEPIKYKAFFYLMAYTGMRRGEMLGLEWKDIDFISGVISIHRTSNYTTEFGTYTDTTKTKRSQRSLKIAPQILDMLKALRHFQESEEQRLGSKWNPTDRLFTTWNGKDMNPQTPYHWLKKFCERNSLPFYGIHSFRHFAASSMIAAGIDVTTVSGTLGHCNSMQTLNTYSHMFQDAQAKVASAMNKAFGFLGEEQKEKTGA